MDKPPNPVFGYARFLKAHGLPFAFTMRADAFPLILRVPVQPAANDPGSPPTAA